MTQTYYCPRGCTEIQIFTSHGQRVFASSSVCPFCEADLTDDPTAYNDAVKKTEQREADLDDDLRRDYDEFIERRAEREHAMVKGIFIGWVTMLILLWALS